jgi:hypothetical protein
MIYDFQHYPTPTGRRVSFAMDRNEYRRAVRTVIGAALIPAISETDHAVGGVGLCMPVAHARAFAHVLAELGGDSAVVARSLADHLEEMTRQLRENRAIAELLEKPHRVPA